MTHHDQLSWERRLGPFAAAAAMGSVLLQIGSAVIEASALRDRPGSDDPDRHAQSLFVVQEHGASILGASITRAVAVALMAGALFYLFRATRYRRQELSAAFRWLLVLAPVLMLVGGILGYNNQQDISDRFTDSGKITSIQEFPTTRPDERKAEERCRKGRTSGADLDSCVTSQSRRNKVDRVDERAENLIDDNLDVVGGSVGLAGLMAIALALVIISLNAMRAGLLSRFMGILGIIAGVLQILPLAPVPVVQLFWLGALGLLFLGRWPGGRGPAWETGEAVPWPSMAEAREAALGDRLREQVEPEPEPNPEATPEHPVSKKRKRKRRR